MNEQRLADVRRRLERILSWPRAAGPGVSDWYVADVADLLAELDAVRGERDKLQRFKDWVHGFLDAKGVPTHPDGPHSKEGCRIGDRLDVVFGRIRAVQEVAESAQGEWIQVVAERDRLRESLRQLASATEDTLRSHPETACCSVTRRACAEARKLLEAGAV